MKLKLIFVKQYLITCVERVEYRCCLARDIMRHSQLYTFPSLSAEFCILEFICIVIVFFFNQISISIFGEMSSSSNNVICCPLF